MADITRANVSLATLTPARENQLTKIAATDLASGDMVYLTTSETFAKCDGTANDVKAKWFGMITRAAKSGQPVTAYKGVEMNYATGLTPSARYYLSTTAGALADSATTGGDVPCAYAVSATTIMVMHPRK